MKRLDLKNETSYLFYEETLTIKVPLYAKQETENAIYGINVSQESNI